MTLASVRDLFPITLAKAHATWELQVMGSEQVDLKVGVDLGPWCRICDHESFLGPCSNVEIELWHFSRNWVAADFTMLLRVGVTHDKL
jgi:hypothetical protein